MMKLSGKEMKLLRVLCEAKDGMSLSQIMEILKQSGLHGWREHSVERTINNLIKKEVVETVQTGQGERYKVGVPADDPGRRKPSKTGNAVWGGTVFDYLAALTTEEELSEAEIDELQRMIDDMDDD